MFKEAETEAEVKGARAFFDLREFKVPVDLLALRLLSFDSDNRS